MENQFNKALLVPVLSMAALYIKLIFGYELSSESIDITVNGILGIVGIVGIFMKPKK